MRATFGFVAVFCLQSLCTLQLAFAQAKPEPVHLDVIAKIKEEGQQRSKVMETVSYLTDVHGPRLTGSPITRRAGEWAKGRLTEWGLQNAHLESWGPFGRGWTLEEFTANMVQPNFSPLIAFPKAWSPSTPKTVRGVPIFLDAKNEAELDKYRGKLHRAIVMLSPVREVKALFDAPAQRKTDEALLALANADASTPRSFRSSSSASASTSAVPSSSGRSFGGTPEQRAALQLQSRKLNLAFEEGAAILVESGRGDGGTVFVGAASLPSRSRSSELAAVRPDTPPENPSSRRPNPWAKDAAEMVPQVVLAVEHYNRIARMLQKGTNVELEFDIASRYHVDDLMSFNIVAEIPGGELKEEIVMLGAHFDSWHSGTGATDNAVGCAVALEAVRILQAIGIKPRRTIRIALWTGEEQGLLGSKAYVGEHFGKVITPTSSSDRSQRDEPTKTTAGDEKKSAPPADAKPADAKPADGKATDGKAANEREEDATKSQSSRERPPNKYELKPEHAKLAAYFNLDNGTGKIRGVYLQGNEALRSVFRAWLTPFADLGASTVTHSNTSGTDHLSFDAVGLPGFQFIQDPLEYDTRTHHSSMDVYERIQEEDVKQASIIMASFVYHAAMRDEKLPRKPLVGEIITPPQQ